MKKDLMNIQQSESEVRFQQDHFNQLLKEIEEMYFQRIFFRQTDSFNLGRKLETFIDSNMNKSL